MKRITMATIFVGTSMLLGSVAHAQATHDHGAPKSGPSAAHHHGAPKSDSGAAHGHDEHCCKPDPNDMKGMSGMAGHDHSQAPKKPAVKKPASKQPAAASQNAK